jgi:hypothetical protein
VLRAACSGRSGCPGGEAHPERLLARGTRHAALSSSPRAESRELPFRAPPYLAVKSVSSVTARQVSASSVAVRSRSSRLTISFGECM